MDPILKASAFRCQMTLFAGLPGFQESKSWQSAEPRSTTPGLKNATALKLKRKTRNAKHTQPIIFHGPEDGSEPATAAHTTLLNQGQTRLDATRRGSR